LISNNYIELYFNALILVLQIRGLYGNEQQKVAAAVTKATELNKNSDENLEENVPTVSVNTTIEQKSSPRASQEEDPIHEVNYPWKFYT